MELDVRRIGLQSCFVALPASLLQILLSSSRLPSFPVILELTPVNHSDGRIPYVVAWNGASSSSPHIEVPEALAECIGLANGARLRVRARGDVAAAEIVLVEPATEDDWEILELNAEYLENHILSQVGVVREDQLFPVWVTGKVTLTLRVISTTPKGIVKLVPGAELVVAPKKRQQTEFSTASNSQSSCVETSSHGVRDVWLRVQELDPTISQTLNLDGITCSTTPSISIFISPDTGKALSFGSGQLVVLSSGHAQKVRTRHDPLSKGGEGHQPRGESYQTSYPVDEDASEEDVTRFRHALVRVIVREGVAAGHVMVGFPLRLFIGVTIHMSVQLQPFFQNVIPWPAALQVSPVLFHPVEEEESSNAVRNDTMDPGERSRSLRQDGEGIPTPVKDSSRGKWQWHRHLIAAANGSLNEKSVDEKVHDAQLSPLLQSWLDAQLTLSGRSPSSQEGVPMAHEVIVHVRIGSLSQLERAEEKQISQMAKQSSNMPEVFLKSSSRRRGSARNLLFLLSAHSDNKGGMHSDQQRLDNKQRSQRKRMSTAYFLLSKDILDGKSLPARDIMNKANLSFPTVRQVRPCYLTCIAEMDSETTEGPALTSLSWLEAPASEAMPRLKVQLSHTLRNKLKLLGTPLPGFVLLHGPPACGKTQLALSLAQTLQEDLQVLAHRVLVRCAELVGEQAMFIRGVLEEAVLQAVHHAPSLIILDDLDVLLPAAETEGPEPGVAVLAIAEYLADLMDLCQGRQDNEFSAAPVAFLATAKAPTALPTCVCFSGRLDFHVQLPAPAAKERAAILTQVVIERGLRCSQGVAAKTAASCDGADATDMELLVDRAVHAAASRFLSTGSEHLPSQAIGSVSSIFRAKQGVVAEQEISKVEPALSTMQTSKFEILEQDFTNALKEFIPAAMRGLAKSGTQLTRLGWEDVGGLEETRASLQEMLEMPVKYSSIFAKAPLRLRTGVLLYGPPGCGKTHIVGAAAAACSLRLISVKGPELLNKYIGASEQGVRDVFARAVSASPCILFFDEFDAIAPKRGHDNTGVTDRVVNQLLTELDGVEALSGVFVFAATSRPDLLDAALLRPGRLDRLLCCDFPSMEERVAILNVLSRKLPLADDVDLQLVASLTEGYSGADLQAILSDAQLESVHSFLEAAKHRSEKSSFSEHETKPVITMTHVKETVMKARPSVPEAERRRLTGIYEAFLGAKTSVSSKSRDIKGKRATLA